MTQYIDALLTSICPLCKPMEPVFSAEPWLVGLILFFTVVGMIEVTVDLYSKKTKH